MALPTISAGDLLNKGITGMPATPELSVADLQAKFDELSIDVIVPKFQALVTALENASAGFDLGVTAPTGITASNKVKSVIDAIATMLIDLIDKAEANYDPIVTLLTGILNITNNMDSSTSSIPTCKAITDYIQVIGGGDMLKAVYDTDDDGIVDNSEKLGGQLPTYYAKQTDLDATDQTLGTAVGDILEITPTKKTVVWASGNTPTTSLCYKIGDMVHVSFNMPFSTEIANGAEVVGTVPLDCRPITSTNYIALGHANRIGSGPTYADNFGILARVDTDGKIYIANYFGLTMYGAVVSFDYKV